MNFQIIAVLVIVGVAMFFVASSIVRKRKAFATKAKCSNDCGCGEK